MGSPRTGDYFGGRAAELAGIIVDPNVQQHGIGTHLVGEFVREHAPDRLTAYTRNPSVLRVLGNVGMIHDVLRHADPERVATTLEHATVHDGVLYHVDRYAPDGLYGTFDPATRQYNGEVLKERYAMLRNKNTALAVSVDLTGGER